MARTLTKLTPSERDLINARIIKGQSWKEIATMLNTSIAEAQRAFAAALQKYAIVVRAERRKTQEEEDIKLIRAVYNNGNGQSLEEIGKKLGIDNFTQRYVNALYRLLLAKSWQN